MLKFRQQPWLTFWGTVRLSARFVGLTKFLLVLTVLGGCVSLPELAELQRPPAPHVRDDAPQGLIDNRAEFRAHFCSALEDRLPASTRSCDDWLHEIGNESGTSEQPISSTPQLELLMVTGAFSECFGEHAKPFAAGAAQLDGEPHTIRTIVVGGRSGTEHNAAQIAAYLRDHPPQPGVPRVLLGYSKGTADILQFLVDYENEALQIDAVVSVAGAVYGSPLADRYDALYNIVFSHLPMNRCEKGDNEVIHSLRTDIRRPWMAAADLPQGARYYSIVAFTTRDRLARSLVSPWKFLLKKNPRNDGQVLAGDALIPGSTVLAYLNVDHWAAAMEIEKELEFRAHRRDGRPFPHTALLDAILRQVSQDLAPGPAALSSATRD